MVVAKLIFLKIKVKSSSSKKVFFPPFLFFSKFNLHVPYLGVFFFLNFFSHCLCQLLTVICVIFEYTVLNSCLKSSTVFCSIFLRLQSFSCFKYFYFSVSSLSLLKGNHCCKERERGELFISLPVCLIPSLLSHFLNGIYLPKKKKIHHLVILQSCGGSFLCALGRKPQNPLQLSSSGAAVGTLLSIQTSLERLS